MLEDDAVFQCQVGAADGVDPIRSRYVKYSNFHTTFIHLSLPFHLGRDATLTVFVPPERPIIINGDVLSTNEDREVEIKCVSRGGKPEPTVSVTDGLLSRVTRCCCCCCGKKAKKALKASKLPGQLLTEP